MSDINLDQIMYTLGQIASAVFPDGLPPALVAPLLAQPATGLGLLTRYESYRQADQRVLGPLFCKLPGNFQNPPGGVGTQTQGQFWLGYYRG